MKKNKRFVWRREGYELRSSVCDAGASAPMLAAGCDTGYLSLAAGCDVGCGYL